MISTRSKFVPPIPRRAIADEGLTRPDWTKGEGRTKRTIWLDRNENADPALETLVSRLVRELPSDTFRLYPDYAKGYEKLAEHLGVQPHNLVFAGGSDGVIRMVFDAYVEQGDAVVLPDPTYGMYPVYCQIAGAEAVQIPYRPSAKGPILDIDEFVAAIASRRPRLVCMPNPDSPTGTVLAESDLRRIIEVAGDVGAAILIDEAYYPFYTFTVMPWIAEYPHTIVARTASKAWGIAGFRVGFAIADKNLTPFLHKVRPNYSVTTPALAVFERLIDHYDEILASVTRLRAGKAMFHEAMLDLGLRALSCEGNFTHVAFGKHAERSHAALADVVLYRRDFAQPALKGFSRFSITTVERFKPIIERIASAVAEGV